MKLGEVAYEYSSRVDNPSESQYDYYIGSDCIGQYDFRINKKSPASLVTSAQKEFKSGDYLLVRRSLYGSDFRERAPRADFDGCCSADILTIRENPEFISNGYLINVLYSKELWDFIVANSAGGLTRRIKWKQIADFEFDLPPLAEQKVLAEKLWAAYEVKQSYLKMIAATEEMVKAQFVEMFGGGNWSQKTLGEIGSFTRGGGFQKSDFVEHGIPCIHYGQIHTKFGPFISSHITEISSDLESKTKFASKGDLIIAITSEDAEGSCKSTAWLGDYPVAVGGHAAIFNHSMNPLYMSFFFKSIVFNHAKMEYIHGTKVYEIKPDDIAKISVPCPPMNLQEQFSAIAQQADKSISELRKSVDAIDKVIKSLINENL